MKRISYLIAVLALSTCVGTALAQRGGGRGGPGGGGGGPGGGGGGGGFGPGGPGGGGGGPGGGPGNFGGPGGGGPGGGGIVIATDPQFTTNEFSYLLLTITTLSIDQKPKLQSQIDTMNAELAAFIQTALTQLQEIAATQPANGTPDPVLTARILKLQDDYQALANEHQLKIDADLTPEQRILWDTYKLNRLLTPKLQRLALTDPEKEKIKTLVDDSAKTMATITDAAEIETVVGTLYKKVVDLVTVPQAAKLLEPDPNQGGRGGPGGPGQGGNLAGGGGGGAFNQGGGGGGPNGGGGGGPGGGGGGGPGGGGGGRRGGGGGPGGGPGGGGPGGGGPGGGRGGRGGPGGPGGGGGPGGNFGGGVPPGDGGLP